MMDLKEHKVLTLAILLIGPLLVFVMAVRFADPIEKPTQQVSVNSFSANAPKEVNEWEGKTFVVDSEEFAYIEYKQVNLWPSFSDRSKVVGRLSQYDEVQVTAHNKGENYCKVKKASVEGWTSCDWLKGF